VKSKLKKDPIKRIKQKIILNGKIIEHQKMNSFVPVCCGFCVTAESINLQLLYSKTTDQFLVLAPWEKKPLLCVKRDLAIEREWGGGIIFSATNKKIVLIVAAY